MEQKVTGYLPDNDGLKKALTGADVILIPAGIPRMFWGSLDIVLVVDEV